MKKSRIVSVLMVIAMILATASSALAAPPPGDWVSGIACQNLSTDTAATVTLSFYPEGSATSVLDYTDPNPVQPGKSANYYTPTSFGDALPSNFLGSVVVSSNTQMACNVNTQTTGTGVADNPYRNATASGFDSTEAAATMYAPQVMKLLAGTWSSYVAVQNTTGAAVPVTVTYKDRFGNAVAAATETATIPANSNKVFYQEDNAGLAAGFVGAATIAADDGTSKLAVIVNFFNNAAAASSSQLQSYSGFAGGSNKLLVPRFVRNYYGYNGGMSIQNIGANTTKVTITFTFAGQTFTHTSPDILAGAAYAIYATNITELAPVDALGMSSRFGNAVIETTNATDEIIAMVNEDNRGDQPGITIPVERPGQGATYNAIPAGDETTTVFFPQVTSHAGNVFSGGFQIANTTATPGTCNISYNAATGANETAVELPANGSVARYLPNVAGITGYPPGYNASVTVTCTQPIVGIANWAADIGTGKVGDSDITYNGLNQ